jgi:hypothetical protein
MLLTSTGDAVASVASERPARAPRMMGSVWECEMEANGVCVDEMDGAMGGVSIGKRGSRLRSSATDKTVEWPAQASRDSQGTCLASCRMTTESVSGCAKTWGELSVGRVHQGTSYQPLRDMDEQCHFDKLTIMFLVRSDRLHFFSNAMHVPVALPLELFAAEVRHGA